MATPPETLIDEETRAKPCQAECRTLIDRVARSPHFARSARLRDFLLYVGHESLKSGVAEIREQEIGIHVFGRSPSYDRSQDNIVRVNASELRKRIEAYFNTEGAEEPLVFSIPRGGYKPVFEWRKTEEKPSRESPEAVAQPVLPSAPRPQTSNRSEVGPGYGPP